MFTRNREDPDLMCVWAYSKFEDAHGRRTVNSLHKNRGLFIATAGGCPLPSEVSILFRWEAFSAYMDRSKMKAEWRGLLGPFVGFDQNWRLLMASDLVYFETAAPNCPREWIRSERPTDSVSLKSAGTSTLRSVKGP